MIMKSGVLVTIIIYLLLSGGIFTSGYFVGKRQNTIINNAITNIAISQSIANSYSISGLVQIDNAGIQGIYNIDINGMTNITVLAISNNTTNELTNYIK